MSGGGARPEEDDDAAIDVIDRLLRRALAGECVDDDLARLPEARRAEALAVLEAERLVAGTPPGVAAADPPGERFGPFEIVRELGRGGQGVVYLATDTRLGRAVALKVLDAASPARLARFRREAEIASRLDHRGICSVLDVGEAAGRAYIAMRYVEGATLSRAEREDPRTPLGARRAAAIVEDCARALHLAHESGIVHRDMKPGNVILGADGRPVILDFGLAGEDGSETGLTQTGRPVGTPAYMSPEQIESGARGVDRRTDVWSLGAILYELLASRRAFEAPTREALYRAILTQEPRDPRAENPAVSRDLAVVVRTALEKDRDRRYRTALDLAEDLRRVRERLPILARPAGAPLRAWRWAQRHALTAAAGAIAFAALGTGLAVSLVALRETRSARDAAESALESERASHRRSRGQELVSLARDLASRSPGLALAVGLEGARLAPGTAANRALLRALQRCREERLFDGGGGAARAVAMSPDSALVAVACEDGFARVFDASTGAERTPPLRSGGPAHAVAFSPDGKRIAVGGGDGIARIFDAGDGRLVEGLSVRRGAILALDFDRDGGRLATGHEDGSAMIHSPGGASPAIRLDGHAAAVLAIRFDPTGSFVATASRDSTARLFAADDGRPIGTLRHDDGDEITGIDVAPNGSLLATSSSDNTIWVWDEATLACRLRVYGHGSAVNSVRFDPSGARLVSTSWDRTVRVFGATDGRERFVLRGHEDETLSAEFARNGDAVVSASADGTARLWRLGPRPGVALFDAGGGPARCARFDRDGRRVLVVGEAGSLRLFDVETGRLVREREGDAGARIAHADFMPGGRGIVSADANGRVRIERPDGGVLGFDSGSAGIPAVVTSPDGKRLLTIARGGEARLFDAGSGRLVRTLRAERPVFEILAASTAAFSPDGRLLAVVRGGGEVAVSDVATGETVRVFPGGGPMLQSLAWSPRGESLAAAADDGIVRVMPLAGGATVECRGHLARATQALFSPDGERVLSCSHDRTARIFDARTGRELATLRGHESLVYSAEFDPAGERVVTASWDGTARVHDARSGEEIVTQEDHEEPVMQARFSPDGRCVLSASRDGTARIWPADPVACARAGPRRELTPAERSRIPAAALAPEGFGGAIPSAAEAPAPPPRKPND